MEIGIIATEKHATNGSFVAMRNETLLSNGFACGTSILDIASQYVMKHCYRTVSLKHCYRTNIECKMMYIYRRQSVQSCSIAFAAHTYRTNNDVRM